MEEFKEENYSTIESLTDFGYGLIQKTLSSLGEFKHFDRIEITERTDKDGVFEIFTSSILYQFYTRTVYSVNTGEIKSFWKANSEDEETEIVPVSIKKIVFVDMDGVLANFDKRLYEINPNLPDKDHPDRNIEVEKIECKPGFYGSLEPMPGAIEAFKILHSKYDVHILSTASWGNPDCWKEKREWVEKYLGEYGYKRITLSHHKNLSAGDYLIDDRIKNGVDKFKGEHIHFGTEEFPDWESVLKYLM